jgi:DNA-binding response OmpR family regulator
MLKLIYIEDDQKLGDLLVEYFTKMGHQLTHFLSPLEGLKSISLQDYDLAILDIMMPEMDGFTVCKEVRKVSDLPIVMLTARDDVTDKVVGLELGADDYMSKPFDPRELLARIESILRRTQRKEKEVSNQAGDFLVKTDQRQILFQDTPLELSTTEYNLLEIFIKNQGKVLTRDDIMNLISGVDSDVFSRSIDIAVSRLRQKLNEDKKDPHYIKTIWGTGYLFSCEGNVDEV